MPEYLHPGVYIEEQPAPQTIEGVSTSTAGFVGVTEKGPTTGLPRLVTSFADFTRLYGSYLADPWGDFRFLAYAVEGFFSNGGQRLYMQRVVDDNAAPASRNLADGFTTGSDNFLLTRMAEDMGEDRIEAVLVSSRGIESGTQLTFIEQVSSGEQEESRTVNQVDGNRVTLSTATGFRFTRSAVVLIQAPTTYGGATNTLRLQAADPGAWGNRLRVQVTPSSRTSTRLLGIDLSTRLQRQNIPLTLGADIAANVDVVTLGAGETANLREDDVLRFDNSTDPAEERTIVGIDTTADEVTLDATLDNAYPQADSTVELVTPVALRVNTDTNNVTVNIEVTPGFQENDRVLIEDDAGAISGRIAAAPPAGNDSLSLELDDPFPATRELTAGTRLRLLNAGRSGDTVRVAGARNLYVGGAVELENANGERIYATVLGIDGDQVQLSENVPATYLEGNPVRTCEFDVRVQMTQENPISGREEVVREENHTLLSLTPGAFNNAITLINQESDLLRAEDLSSSNPTPFNFPTTVDRNEFSSYLYLQNGLDGDPPLPRHYSGTDGGPGARTGIVALEDIDAISIIAAPGITDVSVQGALIEQCERLQDRFAVLDAPRDSDLQQIQQHRGNYDTLYAALYYPWLQIRDPLYPNDRNGRLVPPSGHVIGIYARVDEARGVYKAPANEVVRGITGLEVKLSDREQDILNPHPTNINVIRDFRDSNRGIRVWGARTISSDPAWKYVNVRRLFIFLEESLDEGLQWVVFEPNAEPLWARVRQTITSLLRRVWRDGALAGVTEEEAFFVRCDRTTMTEDDVANGRLIVLVAVAPVRPAEFVIIRISQETREATS